MSFGKSGQRCLALGVASALVLQCAPSLRAGGPLAVCDTGVPLVWPAGGAGIPWNPDRGDLGPLGNAAAVALVGSAFDVWQAAPEATPTFVSPSPLPVDVDITNFAPYINPPAPDGLSAIVFDDTGEIFDLLFGPGSGILGFAGPEWYYPDTCQILEGVCFLNGPAFTDTTYAFDVMVHEFGHYIGLAHTVVNGQIGLGDESGPTPYNTFGDPDFTTDIVETMYPYYFGPGIGTGSLEADDLAAVSSLYPVPGFPGSDGTITGTILAWDSTTPLTGVNVIARNVANPFEDAVSAISGDFSAYDGDAYAGKYTVNGLTSGATYAVYVDEIFAGGFSTPPISLPGPEEFYNGANEGTSGSNDDPSEYWGLIPFAGTPFTDVNIINGFAPGEPLPVFDDGSIRLTLPFPFTFCQQAYSSVWVNANGNVTFGGPDDEYDPTVPDFLDGRPRVAGLWTDLNPAEAGTVTYDQTADVFSVIWQDVPEFPDVGAVSMTIKLYRTGNRVDVQYGAVSAVSGIAGISCGGCGTSGSETPSDLSVAAARRSRMGLLRQPAIFQEFSVGSPFDLATKTALYQATVNYNDNWAGANNTLATAKTVALPFSSAPMARYTEIEPVGGDVDFFEFHVEAGQQIKAEVVRGCLDSLIGLYSPSGVQVAVDDDSGAGLLSRLAYVALETGDYVLAVSAFADFDFLGFGESGGRYVLEVETNLCPGPYEPGPDNWLVNGSFETGDFTGWIYFDEYASSLPWQVTDSSGLFSMGPIIPQDGCYAASNGFDGDGPMVSYLLQWVDVPAATTATLEWQDHLMYDLWGYGATLDREYAVLVLDSTTGDILEWLHYYVAEARTFGDTGWVSHSADLTAYAGQTIGVAFRLIIPEAYTGPGQYELDGVRLHTP